MSEEKDYREQRVRRMAIPLKTNMPKSQPIHFPSSFPEGLELRLKQNDIERKACYGG